MLNFTLFLRLSAVISQPNLLRHEIKQLKESDKKILPDVIQMFNVDERQIITAIVDDLTGKPLSPKTALELKLNTAVSQPTQLYLIIKQTIEAYEDRTGLDLLEEIIPQSSHQKTFQAALDAVISEERQGFDEKKPDGTIEKYSDGTFEWVYKWMDGAKVLESSGFIDADAAKEFASSYGY